MASKSNGHNGASHSDGHGRNARREAAGNAGSASAAAGARAGGVRESMREAARAAKQLREELTRQAGEEVAELKHKAQVEAQRFLSAQKESAAQQIGQMGAAIRQAADRLYEDQGEGLAEYVESAAEGIEKAAKYINERTVSTLARDAAAAVKARPAWFLGAMLLAGLALGRFVKAGMPASDAEAGEATERPRSRVELPGARGVRAQRRQKDDSLADDKK